MKLFSHEHHRNESDREKNKSVERLWMCKVFRFHLQFHFIIQAAFLLLRTSSNEKENHICIVVGTLAENPVLYLLSLCHVQISTRKKAKTFQKDEKNEKRTKALLYVTREKKINSRSEKNIKIMYSVTKIYLAFHENLFLTSPMRKKTSSFSQSW